MHVFKWNSVSSRLDLDTAFDITFRHELACTITSPDRDNYACQSCTWILITSHHNLRPWICLNSMPFQCPGLVTSWLAFDFNGFWLWFHRNPGYFPANLTTSWPPKKRLQWRYFAVSSPSPLPSAVPLEEHLPSTDSTTKPFTAPDFTHGSSCAEWNANHPTNDSKKIRK